MIQIAIAYALNTGEANEKLRLFQLENPQREIINVSCTSAPVEGWFITVTYKIKK